MKLDDRAPVWPPQGEDAKKKGHSELICPALICHHLGLGEMEPAEVKRLAAWVKTRRGLDGLAAGVGSWNHRWMEALLNGLLHGWWDDMAGILKNQAQGIGGPIFRCLFGSEPMSTDYDAMRLATLLIVHSEQTLGPTLGMRANAFEILSQWAGLMGLGSVPWTEHGGEGKRFGPSFSPVGERSPKTEQWARNEIACRLLGVRSGIPRQRTEWAGAVADRVGVPQVGGYPDSPGAAMALIGDARIYGELRFLRWDGQGTLVYRPQRLNTETWSILYWFAEDATHRVYLGLPVDPASKNRGKGAPSGGWCGINEVNNE